MHFVQKGWSTLKEKVYFKENHLATGATKINGKKYNFAKDGSFKTGWRKKSERKNKYYYSTGYLTKGWRKSTEKNITFWILKVVNSMENNQWR